jgi:hypothetical protein
MNCTNDDDDDDNNNNTKFLIGKSEGKEMTWENITCSWNDNIKMYPKEITEC